MINDLAENDLQAESFLVKRLKQGDPEAMNELVDRYSEPLFAFLVRMVDNRSVAEDLFQDTWVRVIRGVHNFRGEARFSTWLFQIGLNLCRNHLRWNKRRSFISIDEQAELAQDPDVDADEIIRAQQVRKLIASLPPKLREVILLHYYHDFSQKKIAEITGLAQGTVKSRLHRATLILRDKLEVRRTSVADLEVD